MDTMDIAALTTLSKQSSLSQAVSIGVLKMAQDNSVRQSQEFIRMMELSVRPHVGGTIDVRV